MLATLMHSFFILALISVQWVLVGLLAWPSGRTSAGPHRRPELDRPERRRPGARTPTTRATVPHLAYMVFQMMFAVITPALITGAFAERKRFKAFVLFTLLWATFVYDPIAHWVWGTRRLAARSWARSTSPAAPSCTSAAASRRWSPRSCWASALGFGKEPMEPHDADHGRARRGAAVVRLVRLQRGQRADLGRPGRAAPSWSPTPPPRWPR